MINLRYHIVSLTAVFLVGGALQTAFLLFMLAGQTLG